MAKSITGARGRNGLREAEEKRRAREERIPAWWDADGWAQYRRNLGLPASATDEDD